MGELIGLRDYLQGPYNNSIFDTILKQDKPCFFHMHNRKVILGKLLENQKYDVLIKYDGREELIQKTDIKFLYPEADTEQIQSLIKKHDKKVEKKNLGPIVERKSRFFIKNKTLFPLMKENEVVFFTLLEGEIIRGIISEFTRFEITVNLKGGIPLTFLRHSVYDLRNKKGRCLLKSTQQISRDWKKSPLFQEIL